MIFTAEQLIKRHGIALRWERTDEDGDGAWVAAFHFAGPDMVSQGTSPEIALENFIATVHAHQMIEREDQS